MQLMIDVERLGPTALFQIGAVAFDFDRVLEPLEHMQRELLCFNVTIAPNQSAKYGRQEVDFWKAPNQAEAKESIVGNPRTLELREALEAFAAWVPRNLGNKAAIWAKPPANDLGVLRANYVSQGIDAPWHYKQEQCLRTLTWSAQHVLGSDFRVPKLPPGMIKHNALHDAALQATVAQAAFRALTSHQRQFNPPKAVNLS